MFSLWHKWLSRHLLLARLLIQQIIFPIWCVVSDNSFVVALLSRTVRAVCVWFNRSMWNLSSNLHLFCESGVFWVMLSKYHLRISGTLNSLYLCLLVHVCDSEWVLSCNHSTQWLIVMCFALCRWTPCRDILFFLSVFCLMFTGVMRLSELNYTE